MLGTYFWDLDFACCPKQHHHRHRLEALPQIDPRFVVCGKDHHELYPKESLYLVTSSLYLTPYSDRARPLLQDIVAQEPPHARPYAAHDRPQGSEVREVGPEWYRHVCGHSPSGPPRQQISAARHQQARAEEAWAHAGRPRPNEDTVLVGLIEGLSKAENDKRANDAVADEGRKEDETAAKAILALP